MAENLSTLSSTGTEGSTTGTGLKYVSMITWEARQPDLVTDGDTEVLECYRGTTTTGNWQADGALDESVVMAGWVTSDNVAGTGNDVTIRTAAGNAHGGILGAGFKLQNGTARTFEAVDIALNVQDIEFEGSSNAGNGNTIRAGTAASASNHTQRWDRIIARHTSIYADSSVRFDISWYPNILNNCLILCRDGGSSWDALALDNSSTVTLNNCTIISDNSNSNTVRCSTDTKINNCVAFSTTGGAHFGNAADSANSDNNASGDTSVVDRSIGTITGIVLTDGVDFVSPSTGDYNPQPGGKLDGVGADLSGTFTDDITGGTRTQWDIGAYGIISAAAFDDTNAFTITIASATTPILVDDLSQAQTFDEPVVVPGLETLVVQELNQAETLDGDIDLVQHNVVAVDDLGQAQTLDGDIDLVQHNVVAVDDLGQAQTLESPVLSHYLGELEVQELAQTTALEGPLDLGENVGDLTVQELFQGIALDEVALTQAGILVVDDMSQSNTFDNILLLENPALLVQGITQSTRLENVVLEVAGFLQVQFIEIAQTFDNVDLTQHTGLNPPKELSQENRLDNVTLIQHYDLVAQGIAQPTSVEHVTLSGLGVPIIPQGMNQNQTLDGDINLTQHHALLVQDMTVQQVFDVVNLGGLVHGSMDGCLVVIAKIDGCVKVL